MNIFDVLKIAGGALALVMSVPLVIAILRQNGAGQSFATWALWTMLNTILTVSVIEQHGNYLLLLGFTIGAAASALALVYKRQFRWHVFDTVVLFLVIACLAVWQISEAKLATIAATAASVIAGVPGLIALWKNPQRRVGNVWLGFAIANGLSFFGGATMTVEDCLAPGVFIVTGLLMVIAGWRDPASSSAAAKKSKEVWDFIFQEVPRH